MKKGDRVKLTGQALDEVHGLMMAVNVPVGTVISVGKTLVKVQFDSGEVERCDPGWLERLWNQ